MSNADVAVTTAAPLYIIQAYSAKSPDAPTVVGGGMDPVVIKAQAEALEIQESSRERLFSVMDEYMQSFSLSFMDNHDLSTDKGRADWKAVQADAEEALLLALRVKCATERQAIRSFDVENRRRFRVVEVPYFS